MSDKAKALARLAARVELPWSPPTDVGGKTLLELGLLCVLGRHLSAAQAEKSLRALQAAFPDWNELRISQIQEFREHVKSKSKDAANAACNDVRAYLQEIFQKNHGFDLEPLREDPAEAAKFLNQLPFLGASAAHLLIFAASPDSVPVSSGVIRVLDRVGAMKRTSSLKRADAALAALVPTEARLDFGIRIGRVIECWCDTKKPVCWECPLLDGCPFGAKVSRDYEAQRKRLDLARKREEERKQREEERIKKRAEAEEKKRQLAIERQNQIKQREEDRRRKAEEKKRAAVAAKKAREEERKRALAKKAAAQKANVRKAAERKAAAKKAAAKKAAAKKAAAKKAAAKKAVAKKVAAKKAAAKKAAAKSAAARKKTASKRKATAKRVPARKAKKQAPSSARKRAAKKTTTRPSAKRKKSTSKAGPNKGSKKKTSRKGSPGATRKKAKKATRRGSKRR